MKPRPIRSKKSRESFAETILVAVTGMSPAIVTETIWALAHEKPPVIPHRVVVVTTIPGRECILKELFTQVPHLGGRTVWELLRESLRLRDKRLLRFGTTPDDIRVITRPDEKSGLSIELADLATPAENAAAADFILDQVRSFVERPDTCLIASLAGGRKSMGALLAASMSLLAKPGDRLTHVLVSEPFENPALRPKFYFPIPGAAHVLGDSSIDSRHPASKAQLQLADVPFVCLRELFPKHFGKTASTFDSLVRLYNRQLSSLSRPPELELSLEQRSLIFAGRPILVDGKPQLPIRAFALFAFLVSRAGQRFQKQNHALEELTAFCAETAARFRDGHWHRARFAWTEDDIRRQLNELRQLFTEAGFPELARTLFPPRQPLGLPADLRVTVR